MIDRTGTSSSQLAHASSGSSTSLYRAFLPKPKRFEAPLRHQNQSLFNALSNHRALSRPSLYTPDLLTVTALAVNEVYLKQIHCEVREAT